MVWSGWFQLFFSNFHFIESLFRVLAVGPLEQSTSGMIITFKLQIFFHFLAFFSFSLCRRLAQPNPQDDKTFLSFSSDFLDGKIRLFLSHREFCASFSRTLSGVYIYQFSVQFLLDHLPYPVLPSLVFLLFWFAAFIYLINRLHFINS